MICDMLSERPFIPYCVSLQKIQLYVLYFDRNFQYFTYVHNKYVNLLLISVGLLRINEITRVTYGIQDEVFHLTT